jgi:ADP-ribosylglycohydrolase
MRTKNLCGTVLYRKTLGCLIGGIVGDAMGTPCEGKTWQQIEQQLGWVNDFTSDGTDDTVMKDLLAEALIKTDGHATLDDWAAEIIEGWEWIFGPKRDKFFVSVIHMAHKLKRHSVPRMAALGNMPSSSSAMCISPVGIVNACDPRAAAMQAYNLASLIHVHDVGFCQDGAAAMAAAVAEAFKPDATVDSVLDAATFYIPRLSGAEMLAAIERMLELAWQTRDYKAFRAAAYERGGELFCRIKCDSRETVPITLALFYLADGDVERAITYGANFGRDADTIASMAGAIAGALRGVEAIKPEWIEKVKKYSKRDHSALAADLALVALRKRHAAADVAKTVASIAPGG